MSKRRFRWSAQVGATLSLMSLGCAPRPARLDQTIVLDLAGPHPTAQLFVGSRSPVTVIFDTGAGTNIVGTALATTLGLPNNGVIAVGSPGATAPLNGFLTVIPFARLGDAVIDNTQAVAIDLPMLLPGIAGVISPNSFSGRLVRFEFARGRAIVMDRTKDRMPEGPGDPYGGEMGHPLPAAQIDLAGTRFIAHLDSGSHFALCLPFEISKQVPLRGKLVAIEPIRMTGATHAAFRATIAGTVRIGPLTLSDPDVIFEEGVPIANVGIRILREMILVLDPEAKRSWMLPAEAI
jgi:hypothetical protein